MAETKLNANQLKDEFYNSDNLISGENILIKQIPPTVVYSGFAQDQYLQLTKTNKAYPKPTISFEFVTRVKQTGSYNSAILGNGNDDPLGGGIFMRTTDSSSYGTTRLYCWGTYNNSSFDIAMEDTGVQFTINEWCWVKCTWDGTKYTWYQRADGTDTWTEKNSITSQACSAPAYVQLGNTGGSGDWYWHGNYDMSNTYIKVDGIKVFDGSDTTQYTATSNLTSTTTVNNKFNINSDNLIYSLDVKNVVQLTQSQYDEISTNDAIDSKTLYLIKGS